MKTMKYKDYRGSVNYSDADGVFYGKLEGIRDLISYEGQDVDSLQTSFEQVVDDYLSFLSGSNPDES
jgi:predicted HicB family RNase H-like nuclease